MTMMCYQDATKLGMMHFICKQQKPGCTAFYTYTHKHKHTGKTLQIIGENVQNEHKMNTSKGNSKKNLKE